MGKEATDLFEQTCDMIYVFKTITQKSWQILSLSYLKTVIKYVFKNP